MANICANDFYISFDDENVGKLIEAKLEKLFTDTLNGEINYLDEGFLEGYFDSRWTFTMHIFENFFDEFEDDSIYMRCLSTEYGCHYVAMNVYNEGSWYNEQTFDF